MEGNDTEALGFPCGAKKNPLAFVLAEVEAYGTPLWPQKIYPLTPLGHLFLPYAIPVGGVSSKASQAMRSL